MNEEERRLLDEQSESTTELNVRFGKPDRIDGAALRESFLEDIQHRVAKLRDEAADGSIELFHVVGASWSPGEDILCSQQLGAGASRVYEDLGNHDDDVISLCWDLDEAIDWRQEFRPGQRILRVILPNSYEVISNNEGNPAVAGRIPREFVSLFEV